MSKVKVAILGATGTVGQRFIELLEDHPYFEVSFLAASEKSAGKTYEEAMTSRWKVSPRIPEYARKMQIVPCSPGDTPGAELVFSGLDSSVATKIEMDYANAGVMVVSNAKNYRTEPNVPILSAEVNPEHLDVLQFQKTPGKIITNSNCTIMGVTIALKPLHDKFGIESVFLVSMQAISGAGYPGVPSMDILGNIVPYIGGEEEKAEIEPQKCLGKVENGQIVSADFPITAHCNRVPVIDGHTVCISIKFKKKPTREEILETWENFKGEPQKLGLPLAPQKVIDYR
ncbi:MAG: aspartate-semialdehyde dehydrogenase [Leptospiraceae bacterium]|nr:aspartate-semialdehyde dehydrogenase [Leptospiraceae bacterium]